MAGRQSRIAEAYVQLRPSMEGFFTSVNSELGKVSTSAGSAGRSSGNIFGRTFSTAFSALKIGALVGTTLTAGIATLGSAAILKGGLTRALNIQDAQAKLKGLGYSLKDITTVSNSTLAAVKGTAFSLDQGMTIASTALAAGVGQGKELTKYLKLVGDTATITGASFSDIGYILNQMTASGKAETINLQELQDRGLPVFQYLQQAYHKNADEIQKMVSSGKISAQQFDDILQKHIGGAALQSGNTVRGALANTGAAFARLGAKLTEGSFPLIQQILASTIEVVDGLNAAIGDRADKAFAKFNARAIPAVKLFGKELSTVFAGKGATLGGPVGNISRMVTDIIDILTKAPIQFNGPIKNIYNVMNRLYAIFLGQNKNVTLHGPIDYIVDGLGIGYGGIKNVVDKIKTEYDKLEPIFKTKITGIDFGSVFSKALSGIEGFGQKVGSVFGPIISAALPVFKQLFGVIAQLAPEILPLIGQLSPLSLIFQALATNAPTLVSALQPVIAALGPALQTILAALIPLIGTLATILGQTLAGAITQLTPVFVLVLQTAANLITVLAPLIASILTGLIPAFEFLFGAVKNVIGFFQQFPGALLLLTPLIIAFVAALAVGKLLSFAGGLFGIVNALGSLAKLINSLGAISRAITLFAGAQTVLTAAENTQTAAINLNTTSQLRAAGAAVTAKAAALAGAAATGVATAAQWAFNVALDANPIGLIVLAIAGLIAVIVLLATKTQFFQGIFGFLKDFITGAIGLWIQRFQEFQKIVGIVFSAIGKFVGGIFQNIGSIINGVGRAIQSTFNGVESFLFGIFRNIGNFFIGLVNTFIQGIDVMIRGIDSISIPVPSWAQKFLNAKRIGFDIPQIQQLPQLATGGNIMGATALVAGEAKPETITDLGQTNKFIASTLALVEKQLDSNNTGATPTIIIHQTINPSQGMDEVALAKKSAQGLQRVARNYGAIKVL